VPQSFHHHPGIYILRQEQRGAGVSQVMDTDPGEFRLAQNRFNAFLTFRSSNAVPTMLVNTNPL
jgi:hypothetical protein